MDPGNKYYAWTINFSRLYATPLLTYKSAPGAAGTTLVPGIATGLGQVSPDGLTWTYHIKQGLKYEDGSAVTAEDVKYAVERTYDRAVLANGPSYFPNLLADPKYPGPYKDPKGDLTSVTIPDPYTIQFHLLAPFPDFDYVVGGVRADRPGAEGQGHRSEVRAAPDVDRPLHVPELPAEQAGRAGPEPELDPERGHRGQAARQQGRR